MSDQQKAAGLAALQSRQPGVPPQGAPQGQLAALEGRYVAPTGAGYQYYQGGPTAPPFNPQALQMQLQQALAPPPAQVPRQGRAMPFAMQNGITFGPRSAGMAQYGLFPNGVPSYPLGWQFGSGGSGGPGGGGVGGGGSAGGSS